MKEVLSCSVFINDLKLTKVSKRQNCRISLNEIASCIRQQLEMSTHKSWCQMKHRNSKSPFTSWLNHVKVSIKSVDSKEQYSVSSQPIYLHKNLVQLLVDLISESQRPSDLSDKKQKVPAIHLIEGTSSEGSADEKYQKIKFPDEDVKYKKSGRRRRRRLKMYANDSTRKWFSDIDLSEDETSSTPSLTSPIECFKSKKTHSCSFSNFHNRKTPNKIKSTSIEKLVQKRAERSSDRNLMNQQTSSTRFLHSYDPSDGSGEFSKIFFKKIKKKVQVVAFFFRFFLVLYKCVSNKINPKKVFF